MLNPYLPPVPPHLAPGHTHKHRQECGEHFHKACLELSQALWQGAKPAQAILQLNKAAMVPDQPAPYQALAWYLINRAEGLFIGNPVRHFQHLASRMSGDHAELRSWRAWACFHLASSLLPATTYPRDLEQLHSEGLEIPSEEEAEKNLPPIDSSSLPAAKALARTHHITRP